MVVNAKVNEVHIGRVSVGQAVEVRLDALPEQDSLTVSSAAFLRREKKRIRS